MRHRGLFRIYVIPGHRPVSRRNVGALFRQLHSALCTRTYNSASATFPYEMYLRYSVGSSDTINSDIVPQKIVNTLLSMSALRYAPGMLTTSASRSLYASITAEITTYSVDTVGDVASALSYFSFCLRLSAHPCALIVPSRFSFKNISISSASFFCSYVMSSALRGPNAYLVCSCINSFITAACSSRLYLRRPDFINSYASAMLMRSIE